MTILIKLINENRKAFSKLGDSSALASSAGFTVRLLQIFIQIILFSEKGQEEEVARGELRCLQEAMARECNQVTLSLCHPSMSIK